MITAPREHATFSRRIPRCGTLSRPSYGTCSGFITVTKSAHLFSKKPSFRSRRGRMRPILFRKKCTRGKTAGGLSPTRASRGRCGRKIRPVLWRAYIEHKLADRGLNKLFYIGPQFRRERPQKGRYRQFYQIGAEVIGPSASGSESPARDADYWKCSPRCSIASASPDGRSNSTPSAALMPPPRL